MEYVKHLYMEQRNHRENIDGNTYIIILNTFDNKSNRGWSMVLSPGSTVYGYRTHKLRVVSNNNIPLTSLCCNSTCFFGIQSRGEIVCRDCRQATKLKH